MKLTIRKPDDCHLHLRRGGLMDYVLPYSERQFSRAVVMPNTLVPITTKEQIIEYYNEIKLTGTKLVPKMTLYLTDCTKIEDVEFMKNKECAGCKLYPIGATVNSHMGVSKIDNVFGVLEYMGDNNIPLLIHCEETSVDIFDREYKFSHLLDLICSKFSKLRVVVEHVSSEIMVYNILSFKNVWATITPHHLTITRNTLFKDNRFNPHMFCLPIVKTELDRQKLIEVATSGNPKFFAGTDSAPHYVERKQEDCIPGCFTAPSAIEHYALAFDEVDKMDMLENFTSRFGAEFYGWNLNEETITLEKVRGAEPLTPYKMSLPSHRDNIKVFPFYCGKYLEWRVI